MPEPLSPPEITPEMRASAMANPNTWLYVIDPAFDENADIPPWGVVGAYPVNEHGEIAAAFRRNTEYRPSPTALRMPEPASELEKLLQLIRAGHRNEAELPAAVLRAPLWLYASGPNDRSVTGFPSRRGTVMVPVCTSVAQVPTAWPGLRVIQGRDLVPALHGHPLVVNPIGPITALIPAAHLT